MVKGLLWKMSPSFQGTAGLPSVGVDFESYPVRLLTLPRDSIAGCEPSPKCYGIKKGAAKKVLA
jgi:hypothetical protein